MKKILIGCTLLLGFLSWSARAQSRVAEVSAQLIGKPLLLRGFWMDDNLHFDNIGQPLGNYKVGSFTESAFDAQKVKINGKRLTIEGQRMALFFDKGGTAERLPLEKPKVFGSSPEKLTIVIDGQKNQDFSKALGVIFASRLHEIAPTLPDFWQSFAQKHFLSALQQTAQESPTAATGIGGGTLMHIGGEVTRPKVLYSVQPKFSDAARQERFSGDIEVYLWVGPDGVPTHISIVRAAGLGLDEKAVAAVSQYRFAPATRNGLPVTVDLYIEVNFQIF